MNNSYNSNSNRNNEVIKRLSLSPKKKEEDFKDDKNDEIQDNESENEEDEETKKKRKKEEYTNFLIRLLTETDTPKRKIMKKGFKLNPISLSKTSLDRSNSLKSLATQESNSITKKKYFTPKEPRKKELKIMKGSENKKKKVNQKNIILSEIKLKQSKRNQFFHKNLDKLYGYNKRFLFYNAKLKKQKWNNLEKYQDDILRVSAINTSKDYMMKLSSDLKTIRINSEQTKPLPPINFKALVHHSLEQNKRKKVFGIRANERKFNQMDEYEKEMYKIKTSMRHKRLNTNNNKFIYKMYEILPEYVVDTLYIKKGNH